MNKVTIHIESKDLVRLIIGAALILTTIVMGVIGWWISRRMTETDMQVTVGFLFAGYIPFAIVAAVVARWLSTEVISAFSQGIEAALSAGARAASFRTKARSPMPSIYPSQATLSWQPPAIPPPTVTHRAQNSGTIIEL